MQLKILSRRTLLITALVGCALIPALLFYVILQSRSQSGSVPLIANAAALQAIVNADISLGQTGLPVRLKIPEINVDSAVEYVGIAPDGTMDIPKNQDDVAWFTHGPLPGAIGSAVITGHYGSKNKKGSVFDDLHTLQKGDKLYIEDDKGVLVSFVVRESRRYDPKADTGDVFGSLDGKAHLNLITCEGVWDKVFKSYSKRLVVFTDKEINE